MLTESVVEKKAQINEPLVVQEENRKKNRKSMKSQKSSKIDDLLVDDLK